MSVSGLISPNNKSWSNLHINSLKVYNDLEVDGSIINNGSINGDVTHENDVLIKGKLTLDGSNNAQPEAIEIIGGKSIKIENGGIDAGIVETTVLKVDSAVETSLVLNNNSNTDSFAIDIQMDKPIQTVGDIICQDIVCEHIQAQGILFDLNGEEIQQYDYHDDVVTFDSFDNPINVNVDVNYSASIIGKDGNDAIVNVVFNFDNTQFEAAGSGTLNSTPIEQEFRPLAGNTCKVLTVVTDILYTSFV